MLWVLRVSRISRNRSLSNPPLHPQSTDCRKARISISRSSLTQSRATVGLHHSTTADPGNSGILGRSERHYRSGSGSHRYIPVNPLLVKNRLWDGAQSRHSRSDDLTPSAVSGQQSGKTPTSRIGKYPGPMPKHPGGLAQPILEILHPAGLPESLRPAPPYAGTGWRDSSHRNQSVIPLIILRPKTLTR